MSRDALLVVSFGGPRGPAEVMPFLRHVVRGRGVPDARLEEVAAHYHHFSGVSPIVAETDALVAALRDALDLPVYLGCRNSEPWLADAVRRMRDDGVRRAAAFVTSAFGSPPGCRQYLDDLAGARAEVEGAPVIDKLPLFGDHPRFLDVVTERTAAALDELPEARLVFVAHSIPLAMVRVSPYVEQLRAACSAIVTRLGHTEHDLVWQSRSGPPQVPWLEPDINDHLRALAGAGCPGVVVVPIGFVADHMEVAWDLDIEAKATADELSLPLARAGTAGTHPDFVAMVGELLAGPMSACPPDCCKGRRRPVSR